MLVARSLDLGRTFAPAVAVSDRPLRLDSGPDERPKLAIDKNGRVARLVAKGVLETDVEPIKNPVTGAPHRIQVVMPEGFEHRSAEVASANIHSTGAIKFDTKGTHSSLANVVQTPDGVAA